jgi:uncharacterized lipoprotein YmbA
MRSLSTFVFLAVLLSACSSTPKTSYYTLSAAPLPSAAATSSGTSVMVGPVSLPDSLDQPLLVVQRGNNQVSMSEYHRWAGSLKGDIGRVIAVNLAHDLGTARVWSYAQSTQTNADYQVLIDVQSFDAKLGDAVELDVLWTILPAAAKTESTVTPGKTTSAKSTPGPSADPVEKQKSGRTLVHEPVSETGFEALVAAQSRALVRVSADISKAIR